MKITLVSAGRRLHAELPYYGADYVLVPQLQQCPGCHDALKVKGLVATVHHDHDTYYADAVCISCKHAVGELQTQVSTIFGIEEDEAVLNGRARVY